MTSKLKLTINPQTQIEIDDAINWYESARDGLGKEFYTYFDGYFKTLLQSKESHRTENSP
jgi:hypothetical protein